MSSPFFKIDDRVEHIFKPGRRGTVLFEETAYSPIHIKVRFDDTEKVESCLNVYLRRISPIEELATVHGKHGTV